MTQEMITMAYLGSAQVLEVPAKELKDEDLVLAWSVLDLLEKKVTTDRKAELREELMRRATEKGKTNDKGSFIWKVGDATITNQAKKGKAVYEPAFISAELDEEAAKDALGYIMERTVKLQNCEWEEILLEMPDGRSKDILAGSLLKAKDTLSAENMEVAVQVGLLPAEIAKKVAPEPPKGYSLIVKKPSAVAPLENTLDEHALKRGV